MAVTSETSPSWFQSKLDSALALARRAKTGIVENKQRITALYTQSKSITDPAERARVQSALLAQNHRNVEIQNFYNDAAQKLDSARRTIGEWFAALGIRLPGLGLAPIAVPIGLAAVLIAAAAIVTAIITLNGIQAKALDSTAKVIKDRLAGKLTQADAVQLLASIEKQAKDASDPLGLKGTLTAGLPIALLIGAVILLPQLLPALRGATSRAR